MATRSLTVDILSGFTTGYIIVAIYDPYAPATPVAYQPFSRPSQNPGVVIFNNVNDIVYEARIYQNSSNVPGGTLLRSYIFDEKYTTGAGRKDLYLTAGATANFNVGANSYSDTSLAGWSYSIEVPGSGTLEEGIDYTVNSAGGFAMVDTTYTFGTGFKMILHFQAIVISASSGNLNSGVLFNDNILITADTTLDGSIHFGKFITLSGASARLNITLPLGATVPNNKMVCLLSEGGSHIMASITTSGSESFKWLNENRSSLYIGQSESLWIYFDGTNWRCPQADGNFKTVGDIINQPALTQLNTLQCVGQSLAKANYPRLWEFINGKIESSQLVDDTTWNYQDPVTLRYPNHGKFANIDTDHFRIPILYVEKDTNGNVIGGTGILRGVQGGTGNRKAGDFEADAVGNFAADIQGSVFQCHYSGNPTEKFTALGTAPSGLSPVGNQIVPSVLFAGKTHNPDGSFTTNNESRPATTGIYLLVKF